MGDLEWLFNLAVHALPFLMIAGAILIVIGFLLIRRKSKDKIKADIALLIILGIAWNVGMICLCYLLKDLLMVLVISIPACILLVVFGESLNAREDREEEEKGDYNGHR